MVQTIGCKYSCHLCGVDGQVVEVPVRTKDQTVVQWMDGTCIPTIARDHATTLSKVMIPLDGRAVVGGPVDN